MLDCTLQRRSAQVGALDGVGAALAVTATLDVGAVVRAGVALGGDADDDAAGVATDPGPHAARIAVNSAMA